MKRVVCLAVAGVLGSPIVASAEPSVPLNHYRAGEMAGDDFALRRADVGPHLELGAQLTIDYARDPFTASAADGESVAVVRDQLTANASASIALFERVAAFAGMPVHLVMVGDSVMGVPDADGTGVGDPYFGARARLIGADDDVFRLGAQLVVTVPLANAAHPPQRYSGEIGPSYLPQLMADFSLPYGIRIGANAGVRLRALDNATVVRQLDISHELVWALGASVPVYERDGHRLTASLQAFGRNTLAHFTDRELTTIEGLAGLRYEHPSHVQFGLATSTGIVNGYGAPAARVLASVAWTTSLEPAAVVSRPEPVVAREVEPVVETQPEPEPVVEAPPVEAPPVEAPPVEAPPVEAPPPDADSDGIVDVEDRCPSVAATDGGFAGCPRITLSDVLFANGSAALSGRARTLLQSALDQLEAAPGSTLRIEGHTDNRGSAETNQALSDRRSAAVRDWLVQHGVDASRVSTIACGFTAPVAAGDDEASRAANRRVHFIVLPEGAAPPAQCQHE